MIRTLLTTLCLTMAVPGMVYADEITLLPSIKLQVGDRDNHGNYWDGNGWHDRDYWDHHYEWQDNHWRKKEMKKQRKEYEKGYRDGRKDAHHHDKKNHSH
ncbi:TPA: DUF2502 domain-containing protein [Enterobacter hormaechei subsp. xiangfangensis]|nr:DUF2502 domain-containing protein [Enterobacter hormaechei subsp. xiangfangensis]